MTFRCANIDFNYQTLNGRQKSQRSREGDLGRFCLPKAPASNDTDPMRRLHLRGITKVVVSKTQRDVVGTLKKEG